MTSKRTLQPRMCTTAHKRFGLFPGRSPLLGESLLFSLPPGTKMFQFPGFAPCIQYRVTVLQTDGLSHSEIRASRDICSYTRLIAAYHVLHRLCEPRHPPYALTLLRHKNSQHTHISTRETRARRAAHTFSCRRNRKQNTYGRDRNIIAFPTVRKGTEGKKTLSSSLQSCLCQHVKYRTSRI